MFKERFMSVYMKFTSFLEKFKIMTALRFLRRYPKSSIFGFLALLVAFGVYGAMQPTPPTFVTATAVRGDLTQTVEAVGTVISEKDLELQFPTLDVVAQVLVKEGDKVKAGQRLASLRSGSLSASVASASASVQSAQAQLTALLEGSRPEDIAIEEANLQNKQASLESARTSQKNAADNLKTSQQKLDVLKVEATAALASEVSTVGSSISQQLATSKTALRTVEGVFNANDVQDSLQKSLPINYETMRAMRVETENKITTLQTTSTNPKDYQQALKFLADARIQVQATTDVLNRAYDIMSSLPETSAFTNTSRETNKGTLATQKSSVQTALSSIDSTSRSLKDASATYDTRIAAEQANVVSYQGLLEKSKADVITYETAVRIQQAQLDLKKAPARKTDIDAATARLNQARADLARAGSQVRDTVLTAPVDGTVTQVNIKVGEVRPSGEASITMLGISPYRIEMFVSEVDIPKVQLAQSGSIELDAFRGTKFALRVSEIDPAATDRDGVSKYRVKLDFVHPHDNLKIGMTGDADIITGMRSNVISVPSRAVITTDAGQSVVRIQKPDGISYDEVPVVAGMDGSDGNVEVTGVKEGDTVIVLIKE